jgi:hypothetical protein
MKKILLLVTAAAALWAQIPVAPTDQPTQFNRGDNVSDYNFLESFELGYRFASTGGDRDMYRSTVNYTDGLRLLSGSLSIQSRDGHGKWFDQISLTTLGLGNDPYEAATLRIEKNRLYRYDMLWRSDAFFDPSPTISYGEHRFNTVRRLQDHDFTLFPQGWFKMLMGYSRDTQSGPALSTIQLFDPTGDEYPLMSNIRVQQNEYRLGAEVKLAGFRLNVLRGWEDYKQDSAQLLSTASQGNNIADLNALNAFYSSQPNHGTNPYWRVALFGEGKKYWSANGRFTYVAGRRAFDLNESAFGMNLIGAPTQLQTQAFGNGNRPTATGNFTFSVFPASMVTVTNQTSVYNIRMSGSNFFEQVLNGALVTPVLNFNYLGIRTIANSTDVQVHLKPWLAVHGGYTYDDRRIGSVEAAELATHQVANPAAFEQTNLLNAGTVGVRMRPIKALSISLDAEFGHASKPFYQISDKDYHALHARAEYRKKLWRASANARTDYNTNSVSLSSFASHTRQYGADVSWTPSERFSIDASYARLHVDTLGGISYFAGAAAAIADHSYYVSNIHSGTLMARFAIAKRADISVGYSHVQDTGDGRANALGCVNSVSVVPNVSTASPCTASASATPQGAVAAALASAQTFPLRFLSPQGKLSIRIAPRIRWNAGYQYYGYREQFSALQNYRAHTGYTSVSWSF